MANNWIYNKDKSIWKQGSEGLEKSDFETLKQDFKSFRFYQKCLSGSTYVIANKKLNDTNLIGENPGIDNIYDILGSGYNSKSFYFTNLNLTYSKPFLTTPPTNGSSIDDTTELEDFVNKVLPDYNFTLKNLFTPERTIQTQFENLYYVDLISTDRVDDINIQFDNLIIDGITAKNGHRILLKDQWLEVTLQVSQNPDEFFYGYYELLDSTGSLSTYRIPSSDNGIYIFNDDRLTKTEDLNKYEDLIRYTICSKLGNFNREKKFRLQRLKNGFLPESYKGETYPFGPEGESMYFEEASSFLIRQRVDYNNIYELVLNKTIKHGTQSLTFRTDDSDQLYEIPTRTISVGEFGVMLIHQENLTNILWNKIKKTLRDISESNKYYWVCGDVGTVLKVSKNFLEIEEIELVTDNSLRAIRFNGISFWNDSIGVVVGEFNNIWYTLNGGKNWKSIKIDDFTDYNFNKVIFKNIETFYVGGDNGVFIEFVYNLESWNPIRRRISKYIDYIEDEFPLVEDITDLEIFSKNNNQFVAITTLSNNLFIYDSNKVINGTWSFIYLDYQSDLGDLKSISYWDSEEKLYITNDSGIYQLDPLDGIFATSNSNVFSVTVSNFLTQSGINDTFVFQDEMIYTGNFSLWEKTNSISSTSSVYDSDFFTRTKPRMLFLNYDVASKLYWFDDFGQYRLPNSIEINLDLIEGDSITESEFSFIPVFDSINEKPEMNWIEYWKDSIKTFKYYSDLNEQNIVKPSFTFSYSDYINKEFIYTNDEITTSYEDILPLMPNAIPPNQKAGITQSSRFRRITGLDISLPDDDNNLYFYDYLGIWKEYVEFGVGPNVGDVLEIKSSSFEGNFIINRVEKKTEVTSPGRRAFLYLNVNPFPSTEWIQLTYLGQPITGQISGSLNQLTLNLNIFNAINASASQTGFVSSNQGVILVRSPLTTPEIYNGSTIEFVSSTSSISFLSTNFEGGENPTLSDLYYSYFYTDFNQNILNNITLDDTFTVRNLNKYGKDDNYLLQNLEKHYISNVYDFDILNNKLKLTPKYSRLTAYYNLQTSINLTNDTQDIIYQSKYPNGFLDFGYTPQYNILSYLSFLDYQKFYPEKEIYSMPVWENIKGPQADAYSTQSSIYIDVGIETNKIYFGQDIKYIYDSLLPWTFIDVYFNDTQINDESNIIGSVSSILGYPNVETFISTNFPYYYGIENKGWYLTVATESGGESLLTENLQEELETLYDIDFNQLSWTYSNTTDDLRIQFLNRQEEIPSTTDVFAIIDVTSMSFDLGSQSAGELISWFSSYSISNTDYIGTLYIIPSVVYIDESPIGPSTGGGERWLSIPELIWKGDLNVSSSFGGFDWKPLRLSISASQSRSSMTASSYLPIGVGTTEIWRIFTNSKANYIPNKNIMVVSFIDESNPSYHGGNGNPPSFPEHINNYKWSSVRWGNGIYVAIASDTTNAPITEISPIMTSIDGIIWTSRNAPSNLRWNSLTYGTHSNLFVSVSSTGTGSRVMTSEDSIHWSLRSTPVDANWNSVTYGKNLFVAVSGTSSLYNGTSSRVMWSTNGISWTSSNSPSNSNWKSVTYGDDKFVAVADSGTSSRVMWSTDGISWTSSNAASSASWNSITYGNGLFVSVAKQTGTNRVMYSSDAISWTLSTCPSSPWTEVTYGNNLFVAVADTTAVNQIMTSVDGLSWMTQSTNNTSNLTSVVYGDNLYVAVSDDATGTRILTSVDGLTWSRGNININPSISSQVSPPFVSNFGVTPSLGQPIQQQPTNRYKRDYWTFTRDSSLPYNWGMTGLNPTYSWLEPLSPPAYTDGGIYKKFDFFKGITYPLVRRASWSQQQTLQNLAAIFGRTFSSSEIDESIIGGSVSVIHPLAGLKTNLSPHIIDDYRINVNPILTFNPYSSLIDSEGNPGLIQFGWSSKFDKRSNQNGTFSGTPVGYTPWTTFNEDLNGLIISPIASLSIYLYVRQPNKKLLIIDKYFDNESNMWVIELHDKLRFVTGDDLKTVTITSRRTLKQISDDLMYLNNIHRPLEKTNLSYDLTSSSDTGGWENYETEIRTKYPTDSYAKHLLSDYDILQTLSSIIYTDYENQLALQTVQLDSLREIPVTSVTNYNNLYQLNFSEKHNIKNGDYILVKSTSTNLQYPNRILGYHHVTVLEGQNYTLILPVIQSGFFNPPNLTVVHVNKDEFFNFQPIDIFNIGIDDRKITQSVEILTKNYSVSGKQYNLMNLDLSKYKFRLIDGLDLIQLNKKYPWILEAEITNATIGIQNDTLTWYKGIWECGRWFEGNWISGLWISGDWYGGNWTSKSITDSKLKVKIDKQNTNTDSSIWFNGRWFGGSWENGTWIDGRWYGGTWSNGKWLDGIWNDGTWLNGLFTSGIWVLGNWKFGKFNCDNGPAFWLDGLFTGGDFENGTWFNGTFDEKEFRKSRFGTRAYNSRNANWLSGKFLSGSFHSGLNIDDNGNVDVSEVHKYSKWRTGFFNSGNFYGGVAYNINFKNAIWFGGIVEDIKINSIQELNNGITFSVIRLEGEYSFNINDEFIIMDNQIENEFSQFGSTQNPIKYKVTFAEYDVNNNETIIYPNINIYQFNPVSGTSSNLRLVSYFENSTWKSGVWYNGLFKNGTFEGGVWYNGKFIGNWG